MDLHFLSLAEVRRAFLRRTLSPTEYAQALLARIEACNPLLHAVVDPMEAAVREAARRIEARMAAGEALGPLAGIPIGVKDVIDVQNVPTRCQSRFMQDHVAHEDAEVVARLRAQDAIVAGKLATWEFAFGGPSFDLPAPPARNPWKRALDPGGSSSGSAVAVAAGMLPAAIGTDTAGSIRFPASACGIVGLKPTFGLVDTRGVFPLAPSLDHVGPMTRTVEDNALVLSAISGARGTDYLCGLGQGVRSLRIGVITQFHAGAQVAHPDVLAAFESVVQTLARAGAAISPATLPPLPDFQAAARTVLCVEGAAVHEERLRTSPGRFGKITRERLLPGLRVPAVDYVQALRRRVELAAAVDEALRDADVLMTVTTLDPPCGIRDEAGLAGTQQRQVRMPFNLTGHPALSLMCGLSAGAPLAVQMIGRRHDEGMLYRVAAAYERSAGWSQHRPPEPAGAAVQAR